MSETHHFAQIWTSSRARKNSKKLKMLPLLAAGGLAISLRDYDDDDDRVLKPRGANSTVVHKFEKCPPRKSYPKPANMKGKMMSLGGEDAYLEKHVFKNKEYGVYLDIGCGDGYNGCSSYYFNKVKNWRGNCLDPDPVKYDAQYSGEAKRIDGLRLALTVEENMKTPFAPGYGVQVNNTRGMQQAKKAGASTIPVLATTPQKLLHLYFNEISMTSLDYVNVDTEGNELEILKAWPYHSHCVNAFTVANPYYCNEDSIMDELEDILVTRGYIHKKSLRYSEVFVKVESCPRDIDDTALHRA